MGLVKEHGSRKTTHSRTPSLSLSLLYHGTMMTTIMFMMTIAMSMTTKLMKMDLMFRLKNCFRMMYISIFTILFAKIVPSRLDTLVRWNYKIMVVFFFFFFLSSLSFFQFFSSFFVYLFDVKNGKGLTEGPSVLANDPYLLLGLFS